MKIQDFKREKQKFSIIITVLLTLTFALFFCSMCIGRYGISFSNVVKFFSGQEIPEMERKVITYLRIPRTLVAMLVGVALSVSGVIYQSVFNNKLVSPDLLGVSSGSSVGACFAILLGFSAGMISVFSFITGFIAVVITVIIAKIVNNKSNVVLILSGISVSGLMSSIVGLMKYLADNELKLAEMTYWLLGDVSGSTMTDVFVILPIVVAGVVISILLSWKINVVSLGERDAKALGVNYKLIVAIMISVATLLTASAVSVSGTIGWVGLVIPNIVRLLVGSDNRKVIPVSALTGALFMIIVDTICRSVAPNEIPLSVVTGIIGTPLFIYAIFKRRKEIK